MQYLPEGRLLYAAENQMIASSPAALKAAMEQETVLEARAALANPDHSLSVPVGNFIGHIPREEAALGIREGAVRDIAILSRVGQPVAFTVTAIEENRLLLSRRRAQELARNALFDTPTGTVLPATVTHMENFGTFVDIGCGFPSLIGMEACSVSRVSHPSCRFHTGQEIFVVLAGHDRERGRVTLSHKELLGTWLENAAPFSPGMTVPGIVRGIQPYGAFIELTANLTGLADKTEGLRENERVSVYIKSIQPERMKIKLNVIRKLAPEPASLSYFITEGRVTRWEYSPPCCVKKSVVTTF